MKHGIDFGKVVSEARELYRHGHKTAHTKEHRFALHKMERLHEVRDILRKRRAERNALP